MSFLERARQAAEQARQAAVETTERAHASMRDPATKERARKTLGMAKRGITTAVERIDPAVLADVIIKATTLQERANAALRAKSSPYRISEIAIGASIPPSITFSIGRLDDPSDDPAGRMSPTAAAVATGPLSETITTLDGTELEESDLENIG
jgi:uncharacterized protein (DUF4415 family)